MSVSSGKSDLAIDQHVTTNDGAFLCIAVADPSIRAGQGEGAAKQCQLPPQLPPLSNLSDLRLPSSQRVLPQADRLTFVALRDQAATFKRSAV